MSLREEIEQEIRQRGPMPFSRYMDLCLYHPELGYYSRNAEQFGKAGDFYTASDVHAVFGRLLARQFEEIWRALRSPANITILELGPGRGLFARDLLGWSEKTFPEFFQALCYQLCERSPALRQRLAITLTTFLERHKASFVDPEPENLRLQGPAIVFANEFFDAFPVEILSTAGQLYLSTKDGKLVETWLPPVPELLEFLDHYAVHPEPGERVEVSLSAFHYLRRIASAMPGGLMVLVDYGYTRDEQLAGRHRNTLTTYRRHSVSHNPYEAPGEQDITAHVNFTALAAAAEQCGMLVQPLLTQSQFLMGIGEDNQFADVFEDCRLPQERAKVALQLKHLVTPAGMGETFHVLIAGKGISEEKLTSLSGLSFSRSRI